jgi:transaldolase/glucose-6-phosphate isomerase
MNPVKALQEHGQSVWLDFLARGFIAKGNLKKLVDEDGVRGVTSNPSIFEKAIAHIYTDASNAVVLRKASSNGNLEEWLKAHFARLRSGDYAAFLAYVARNEAHADLLQKLRLSLRDRRHVATCLGFGPRFLHSTGQAYKGGPNSGVFLQITTDDPLDLAIPGHAASFGVVKAAQARGDFEVLTERGRRAIRVHLKGDVESGLCTLEAAIGRAVG